jgi:hypothetical protein
MRLADFRLYLVGRCFRRNGKPSNQVDSTLPSDTALQSAPMANHDD